VISNVIADRPVLSTSDGN